MRRLTACPLPFSVVRLIEAVVMRVLLQRLIIRRIGRPTPYSYPRAGAGEKIEEILHSTRVGIRKVVAAVSLVWWGSPQGPLAPKETGNDSRAAGGTLVLSTRATNMNEGLSPPHYHQNHLMPISFL